MMLKINTDYMTDSTKINADPKKDIAICLLKIPSSAVIMNAVNENNTIQKSKLLNVESKTVARLLKTILGYAISGAGDKGDNVRENQFNKFMNKEILQMIQKEKKTKAQKTKGLREIFSYVTKKKDLPPKERDRLLKKVLVELEKNAPPQAGLVFDETKGRWVNPENVGLPVHALQGGKRLRGARIGSEKFDTGGTLQRLPKGTRQKVRGKLSQVLPKSLKRRGVLYRQ